MKNTNTFESNLSNEVYQIKKNFNCNSKMLVYLIECRISEKQYNGITVTKVCARASNYKTTYHNFRKEEKLPVTRHVFTSIISRVTDLWLGDHNNRPCWNEKKFMAKIVMLVPWIKDICPLPSWTFCLHCLLDKVVSSKFGCNK